MVYIDEDNITPAKQRGRNRATEDYEDEAPKRKTVASASPSGKRTMLRWFFIGSLTAIVVFVAIAGIAWVQISQFIAQL